MPALGTMTVSPGQQLHLVGQQPDRIIGQAGSELFLTGAPLDGCLLRREGRSPSASEMMSSRLRVPST